MTSQGVIDLATQQLMGRDCPPCGNGRVPDERQVRVGPMGPLVFRITGPCPVRALPSRARGAGIGGSSMSVRSCRRRPHAAVGRGHRLARSGRSSRARLPVGNANINLLARRRIRAGSGVAGQHQVRRARQRSTVLQIPRGRERVVAVRAPAAAAARRRSCALAHACRAHHRVAGICALPGAREKRKSRLEAGFS